MTLTGHGNTGYLKKKLDEVTPSGGRRSRKP